MLCKLYINYSQVNDMQNKDHQKKNIKNNFHNFSRKEKAITRYTRIYVKLNDSDNTKQANI